MNRSITTPVPFDTMRSALSVVRPVIRCGFKATESMLNFLQRDWFELQPKLQCSSLKSSTLFMIALAVIS
jgi:hypothetical protein